MTQQAIHQCTCAVCQEGKDEHTQMIHHQINVVISRLDEQQRRWYAALEANRHGHGGIERVHQITGLSEKTIRRGQQELAIDLEGRPTEGVRLPGGGRLRVEKKSRLSKRP